MFAVCTVVPAKHSRGGWDARLAPQRNSRRPRSPCSSGSSGGGRDVRHRKAETPAGRERPPENGPRLRTLAFRGGRFENISLQEGGASPSGRRDGRRGRPDRHSSLSEYAPSVGSFSRCRAGSVAAPGHDAMAKGSSTGSGIQPVAPDQVLVFELHSIRCRHSCACVQEEVRME